MMLESSAPLMINDLFIEYVTHRTAAECSLFWACGGVWMAGGFLWLPERECSHVLGMKIDNMLRAQYLHIISISQLWNEQPSMCVCVCVDAVRPSAAGNQLKNPPQPPQLMKVHTSNNQKKKKHHCHVGRVL